MNLLRIALGFTPRFEWGWRSDHRPSIEHVLVTDSPRAAENGVYLRARFSDPPDWTRTTWRWTAWGRRERS